MALKERISEEDLALLEVIEDPIWCGEFLRQTANGEMNRELWPKGDPFKYRWYQKDILSDTSPYISICAGRAVGKCSPATERVYTTEGYKTIRELLELPSFNTFALDDKGELVIRRAKAYPDKESPVYAVETESGKRVETTLKHPYLTREGWKKLKDLQVGDEIAVATSLPPLHNAHAFEWHELRWFGYYCFQKRLTVEAPLKLRYRKQVAEMRLIAKKFDGRLEINDRTVRLARKTKYAFLRNNATWLIKELGYKNAGINGVRYLTPQIIALPNEALQVFIEALFSQYADLSLTAVSISYPYRGMIDQLQEILLRFGIESRIKKNAEGYTLSLLDSAAIYKFYTTFNLPGVAVQNIPLPPPTTNETPNLRFEQITKIVCTSRSTKTYAIYVYKDHNYISSNVYVHNSLVLEDKIVYEIINADKEFPVTKEQLLTTANQAQLNPILDRIITRFSSGKFLQSFIQNQINKSQGTLKSPIWGFTFTARIAAGKGESNLVGLHLPRIKTDEAQLFSMAAYTQMIPSLNTWEPKTQVLVTGVPNGMRNTILYAADQRIGKFKKYRIPSHNNPYYSRQDDRDNIKRFGGENADEYRQLVLGQHGAAAQQVLGADSIKRESYDFYSYRYTGTNKARGETYQYVLERPKLPEGLVEVIAVCDFGYVDPTVINIIGRDKKGISRVYIRYRLQRIDFPLQEQIINWLDDEYKFHRLGFDIGAGGSGAALMQGLCSREEYKHKKFERRISGYNNSEAIVIGKDETTGSDIRKDTKSVGTEELVKRIEEGDLVFSELDAEGTAELEKLAKQKSLNGVDRYFILADSGKGKSSADHIYSSLLIWGLMVRESYGKRKKKLGRSSGIM